MRPPRGRRWVHRVLAPAALFFALLVGCPTPRPGPGGPTVTPTGFAAVAQLVIDILSWALPAARVVIGAWGSQAPQTTADILRVLDTASQTTLPGFREALVAYDRAGGDRCQVRATGAALTQTLVTLAESLAAAGWGMAVPIGQAISNLGAVVDTLAQVCLPDAGFYSMGGQIATRLQALPSGLRPFPSITPP